MMKRMNFVGSMIVWVVLLSMALSLSAYAMGEGEPNDSKSNATAISLNTDVEGNISRSSDHDWFEITVPENGYISVHFSHEMLDSYSSYWRIDVYQSDGVTGIDDTDRYWLVSGNQDGETPPIGVAAGKYYVKVQYNPYNHSDAVYRLRVNYTQWDRMELEPNHVFSKATEIESGAEYMGTISHRSDIDWYRFTLTADADIHISFSHEMISSSSFYWDVELYQEDGVTRIDRQSVLGNANKDISAGKLNAGTYLVKIAYHPYNHSDVTYRLKVSEKHDCKGSWVTTKNETCLESGMREMVCQICSAIMEQESIPASGHTLISEETLTAPTCTTKGLKRGTCSFCGEKVTVDVEMLSHVFTKWEIIAGNKFIPPIVKEKQCSECGAVEQLKDWSYSWVTVLAGVALVGVLLGVINYAKAFKNSSGYRKRP